MKYAQFGQTLDIENKKYNIGSKMHGMRAVWTHNDPKMEKYTIIM